MSRKQLLFSYMTVSGLGEPRMCRNIRPLFNFDPPATEEEIHDASLQFVRKISGFARPSQASATSFQTAVEEITVASRRLLKSLESRSPPRNRDEEAAKAKARSAKRFAVTTA